MHHVLLVDDDADSLDIVRTILECEGAAVTCAGSAAEALVRYLGATVFDIVVSDLAMPGHDGLWLIQQLRRNATAHGKPLRAVALSAHARDEIRWAALEAGYDVFVAKPFEIDELRAAVLSGR
jgi:CheY-like chemotaxis protein